MPIKENIFKKYKNDYFIETGSHVGEGIKKAIEAGFTNIISIELSEYYYNICKRMFQGRTDITLYLGDSEDVLGKIISNINVPITFWLDGHNSGGNTAWGKHESPLMQELEIIKNHHIKTHTIIIDDMWCWKKPHYDFDEDDIRLFVKEINKEYEMIYENGTDILVAYIKQ
jgi:hypothetical protein